MLTKLIVLLGFLCLCRALERSTKDSYLTAFEQTKVLKEKSDPDNFFPGPSGYEESNGYPGNPGYPGSGYNGNGYPPPTGYEKPYYGPPKPVYGPPEYHPAPNYPPPPPHPWTPPDHFVPHALLGILDKIKYKIDLLTIGKIILKLVIFKKIVTFIGILCLLLFIPSLKKKHLFLGGVGGGDDIDMFRNMGKNQGDDRFEDVSSFILDSIEKFSKANNDSINCKSMFCQTQRLSKYIDGKVSYEKLINSYSKELS